MLVKGDEEKVRVGDSFFVHGRNPTKVNLLGISEDNVSFELTELTGYSERSKSFELPLQRGSERSVRGINLELIEMIPSEKAIVLRVV